MKYHDVALKALKKYSIQVEFIEFMTEATNVFYLVKDKDQKRYTLKIFQEASSTIYDNLAEHYLIGVIAKETDILTPQVYPNSDGDTVTKVPYSNKRGYKRVALYEYIEGEPIHGHEDINYFYQMGVLVAKMHEATKGLKYPENVNPKQWDKIFYYEDEVAVYHKSKFRQYITDEMIEILDELIPYIDKQLAAYYNEGTPLLIHGDLNPWNILTKDGRFIIYDFEEGMLAYPIHDIAVFMYYYRHNNSFEYFDIKEAFFKGYETIRKLPPRVTDRNLEMFMMARRINFFNYVLTFQKDPSDYIALSFPHIKEYYLAYK